MPCARTESATEGIAALAPDINDLLRLLGVGRCSRAGAIWVTAIRTLGLQGVVHQG